MIYSYALKAQYRLNILSIDLIKSFKIVLILLIFNSFRQCLKTKNVQISELILTIAENQQNWNFIIAYELAITFIRNKKESQLNKRFCEIIQKY